MVDSVLQNLRDYLLLNPPEQNFNFRPSISGMIHVNSRKSEKNIKWCYGSIEKKISCLITCTSSNTYYDTIWSAQALAVTSLALRYLSHISKCPPFGKRRYLCWRWQLEDFIAKAHKVIWSFYAMHSMYMYVCKRLYWGNPRARLSSLCRQMSNRILHT